ncbi:MAG: P-loop NTPase [Fibrobacterota bacterium]
MSLSAVDAKAMDNGLSNVFSPALILSVGGGKGGVGKSTVAAGVAGLMAASGKRVILVDADLGGANLHLFVGVRYPEKNLNDFLAGRITDLRETLITTRIPGVQLISGVNGIHESTNLRHLQKQKLLAAFKSLEADVVIIDVGAGADEDNTDFHSLSENGIIVITNEPTSVENAYSFLKNSVIRLLLREFALNDAVKALIEEGVSPRRGDFIPLGRIIEGIMAADNKAGKRAQEVLMSHHPRLIVNMVKRPSDVSVKDSFTKIVKRFLDIDMVYVGYVVYDETVSRSVKQIIPITEYPDAPSVDCLRAISKNLISLEGR